MPRDFTSQNPSQNGPAKNAAGISLKLEFSKAADYKRVDAVFNPAVKDAHDPNSFVLKRAENSFKDSVDNGRAVFLSDQNKKTKALVMAYHYNDNNKTGSAKQDYTEIGTTMSFLPGYSAAMMLISAIAIKEWFKHPPKKVAAAEIEDSNHPSLHAFRDRLKWEAVKDRNLIRDFYNAHDISMANPKDRGKGLVPPKKSHHTWYQYNDKHIADMAKVLLTYMQQGGLLNKKTGQHIAVDFSALEKEGLTTKRLKAMAGGETSRKRILAI